MNLFSTINIISILMIGIFLLPLLTGLLYPISSNRVQHSFLSILNNMMFVIALILAGYLVRNLFSGKQDGIFAPIYQLIPSVEDWIIRYQSDIIVYIITLFVCFSILLWILEILTIPLNKFVLSPLTNKLSSVFNEMTNWVKQILSVLWSLPKSISLILVFSLLLNFYSNFINNPTAINYINQSAVYQTINNHVLRPLLSTDIAKKLPVLINDSFKKAAEDFTPSNSENGENPNYWKVPVIKYFNGVTLDEAVKSSSEIDNAAKQIVGSEKDDKLKAYLLYQWISQNIEYDQAKAETIVHDSSRVNSGSIVTYAQREGVCFDYSCLYVSMCVAVGLKVRFVTGLGYTGVQWGDHAWNQVYYPQEERWISVDTTFGSSGYDYFDNADFSTNHKYDVIQYEW